VRECFRVRAPGHGLPVLRHGILETALGPDDPAIADIVNNLGWVYKTKGDSAGIPRRRLDGNRSLRFQ
jgi:hypothetical protein